MRRNPWKLLTSLLLAMTLVLSACGSGNNTETLSDTDKKTDSATTNETTKETDTSTKEGEAAKQSESTPKGELPRDETLYFGGLQWGAINGWNGFSDDMNNGFIEQKASGSRTPMFETLYMYNMLDGSMTPLLADGDFEWNDDLTEITVKIKDAAMWSDGTKVTAHDVAYTFEASVKHGNNQGNSLKGYIDTIEAIDDATLIVKALLNEEGNAKNPLILKDYLAQAYVLQKAWLKKLEDRNGGDSVEIKKDRADDIVYSGPYNPFYADDQKIVLVRDDNYWGQDASMWGKLPAPKYLAHAIYSDNAATEVAFKAGEIDVNQQFLPNIQDLWLKEDLPVSTYMEDEPYGVCVTMPTAYYNVAKPGLDNAIIRKAIAMAVDYDAIIANAMTNQSPSFKAVPRSIMNPTAGEQAKFDHGAVKDLQWAGSDIKGAKKMLDDADIVDTDGDGIREYNGENLSFNACCPNGWSDWMAAIEIVASAGEKIGIEITTEFPEWSVYQTVVTAASQDEYDIFMMWTDGAAPSQPWARVRQLMSSEYNGVEGNWSGNWGHYSNERVDELIKLIPAETKEAKLKEYYTEAVEIYLTEVPSFSLMYRPDKFHAVSETVWTNYPEDGDGLNIPPVNFISGYSIAGLYQLELLQ